MGSYTCLNWATFDSTNPVIANTILRSNPIADTGHLGAKANIINGITYETVASSAWYYSFFPTDSLIMNTDSTYVPSGSYYSQGETSVWNGYGYTNQYTYGTPMQTVWSGGEPK